MLILKTLYVTAMGTALGILGMCLVFQFDLGMPDASKHAAYALIALIFGFVLPFAIWGDSVWRKRAAVK